MPIKSCRVNLSVPPSGLEKIRKFGRAHCMSNQDSTICLNMIRFLLTLQDDSDIDTHLAEHGGELLDLIRRAVKKYIDDFS